MSSNIVYIVGVLIILLILAAIGGAIGTYLFTMNRKLFELRLIPQQYQDERKKFVPGWRDWAWFAPGLLLLLLNAILTSTSHETGISLPLIGYGLVLGGQVIYLKKEKKLLQYDKSVGLNNLIQNAVNQLSRDQAEKYSMLMNRISLFKKLMKISMILLIFDVFIFGFLTYLTCCSDIIQETIKGIRNL